MQKVPKTWSIVGLFLNPSLYSNFLSLHITVVLELSRHTINKTKILLEKNETILDVNRETPEITMGSIHRCRPILL